MGVIAVAESIVDAPLAVAFARFIDFSHWRNWAPPDFHPLSGPSRALREGDVLKVALGTHALLKTNLTLLRVRTDKEICWRGGVPGLVVGEHSYFFSDADGKTRVRSEERFSGVLVAAIGKQIERAATQHAVQLIENFGRQFAS